MLSPQEALMMQAAYDEQDRQQAQNTAGLLGAAGGGLMGIAGGQIPHAVSKLMSGAGSNAAAQTTQAALKNGMSSLALMDF